jgi:hypothetical protein
MTMVRIKSLKTIFIFMSFLFYGCVSPTTKGTEIGFQGNQFDNSFDNAIFSASEYLISRIPDGSKIAVINLYSRKRISNYITDIMNQYLVTSNKFTVIERRNLEYISNEIMYQLSGNVDDDSMVSIGKELGAEYIIAIDITFRPITTMSIIVHNMQTAQIIANNNYPFSEHDEKYEMIDDTILSDKSNHTFSFRLGYVNPQYIEEYRDAIISATDALEIYDVTKKYLIQEYEHPSLVRLYEIRDLLTRFDIVETERDHLYIAMELDEKRAAFFNFTRPDGKTGYFLIIVF